MEGNYRLVVHRDKSTWQAAGDLEATVRGYLQPHPETQAPNWKAVGPPVHIVYRDGWFKLIHEWSQALVKVS